MIKKSNMLTSLNLKQVQSDDNKASFSHELIAGAAAYEVCWIDAAGRK